MGWKIFAVFFAILSLWGVFDARSYETTWEAIGLVLTLPAPIVMDHHVVFAQETLAKYPLSLRDPGSVNQPVARCSILNEHG